MKKILSEKGCCCIFNILAILMYAVFFYYGLGLTGENNANLGDEFIYFRTESVILSAFWIGVAISCLYFIGKVSERFKSFKSRNLLLAIVCILSAIISFLWIFNSKTEPFSDQLLICYYANDFNHGDYSALQRGGYVALYPQQLGMITLLRFLFYFFGTENYMAFKCLSAASVPLLVFSGCKVVRILSDDNVKAEIYYLLSVLFCFPMYVYTSFVYGDLISTSICMFSVWMFLSCIKKIHWGKLLSFGISIGIAVQLRKNVLILVAALGIVVLVKLLFGKCWKCFIVGVTLVFGVLFFHLAIWWGYHDVRPDDATAIPASLFISMGLNDDYGHPGWYNDYHYATFKELDYDTQAANAKAFGDLQLYFDYFMREPDKMVDFFVRKMNSQWNAPMYQCIVMNSSIVDKQPALIQNIYQFGRVEQLIEFYMKVYQLLLYGGILFLLAVERKNYFRIEKYVLLIAVYGGFLFSMIWEAKTRYIFPYLLMQLPYMAIGIKEIVNMLEKKIKFRGGNKAG